MTPAMASPCGDPPRRAGRAHRMITSLGATWRDLLDQKDRIGAGLLPLQPAGPRRPRNHAPEAMAASSVAP